MKLYVASSWRNAHYPGVVLIPEKQEPELMYKLFSGVACSIEEVMDILRK